MRNDKVGLPLLVSRVTASLMVTVARTRSAAFSRLFCMPSALLMAMLLTVGGCASTTTPNVALKPELRAAS